MTDEIDDDMIDQESGTNSWWDLKFKVEALETALADANERMSKLDFERTAAELERDIAVNDKLLVMQERDQARADFAACEADADRLVELSKANVRRLEEARANLAAANALLTKWDALINYQFSGSRNAMSAMTECAQETAQHLYGPPPWPSRIDAALKGDGDE